MPTFVSEVENANLSRYIEPNMSFEADFVPNDPDWPKQWGLAEIEADYAWNITIGGPSVLVAIIDTGIDWNHPDLTANYVPLGYDWVNNDEQPMDDFGHGTHVAGIIAAVTNNGLGIAGLAQAKIMAEKVLDETGYGSSSDISQGIIHAVDRGAKIINLSLGSYDRSKLLHESVKYAYDHGVLIVAAAGNDATTAKCYPAAYDEVAAVSATDKLDNPAEFTNYGDWVDVAAPGVDVYSTLYSNSYAYMSGTSMASPHAAGVAALIWSRFPNMTRDQVWAQLQYSTDDLGEPGIDVHYGFGRINARKAVEQAPTGHDVLILNLRASLLTVNTTILNMGTNSEGNIMVQLLVNGSRVNSTIISFLASGASTMVSFSLSPDVQGLLNVTSYVVPLKGETMVENNALSAWMRLRLPLVIRVPEQYSTIQDAIDAANEEDTIFVASGVYYENVHIRKDSLRLIGEEASSTIIDGGGSKDVVLVWADHTEIRGFTVRNSGGNPSGNVPFSGVLVYDCENVNITDMVAANNWCGIFLYCSSNVELEGNRMAGNHFNFGVDGYVLSNFIHCIDESNTVEDKPICYIKNGNNRTVSTTAGCVLLVNSTNITVEKLELVHNHAGVFCLSSTNISVSSLKASWNNAGVYVRNCSSIIVRSSNLTENGFGILVEDSEKVTAKSNNINNSRSFGDGIKIIHSTKCQARLNVLTDNTCGLYLSYSSNNTVSSNVLRRNYIDLWLYCSNENVVSKNEASNSLLAGIFLTRAHNNLLTENCLLNNIELFYNSIALIIETSFNNSIYHNNFINNTHNVFIIDSANAFDDGYPAGGNYWSDYMDVDLYSGPYQNETGSDGIGDTPYAIDADNLDRYPIMSRWTPTPPVITASANIEPHTLNLKSRSEWIICHIELPEDYDVADINASTARLNDTIPADLNATTIGDCDNDGIPDLTAKFNRTAVSESILSQGIMLGNVTLTLTGKLYDDTGFEGSDVIEVRMPGDVNMDGKVRIADVLIVAQAFGTSASNPGNPPRWNPVADETGDGQIRVDDVLAVALNFGKTYV
jgi:parallel beta-helix repeat protein